MMTLDQLLEKANRRLNDEGMNKETSDKVRQVIEEMYNLGIYVGVAQGYRSIAEQNTLYSQGRRGIKGEKVVTNARGGQSNHNYGVAVDLFQYTPDGTDAIWDVNDNFRKIIAAMKAKGFKWGGDWKSFKDYPHFELYNVVDGEKPKPYSGSVQPTTVVNKGYLEKGDSGEAVKELQTLLEKAGYDVGEVDGEFGDKTDAQVRKFQSDESLVVDGVAGVATMTALKSSGIIGKIRVIVPTLNVRSGGSVNDSIIGQAHDGDEFNVTANYKNLWMEIIYHDGVKGWVSTGKEDNEEYVALVR